ncbi:4-hydroxybenzoate polyprenyl transferase [Mycena maculata]|uniref:4-hydroxybenzoate polyprenyl transferase n=1 Tax=Mycena maculata TaxID=230809 RepID=A0AAD7I3J5_9AGAR|nr:4-hydroxybenzoate polyprenyl transferase [Mycena maculata]
MIAVFPILSSPLPCTMSQRTYLQCIGPWLELARFHKPAGALLILWPFVWGLAMSARSSRIPPVTLGKGLVGGCNLSSSGAGCIWNDIVDRDLDKHVERTKHRPLADGRISVSGALIFLFVHLLFLVSSVAKYGNKQLRVVHWPRLHFAFITIFPLAGGYPFIKRISYWPQAWLGVAFNMGTIMACSWATGQVSRSSIALALAGWFWTMWYDTIYGSQDKKGDIKFGVGSTALLFKSTNISRSFLVIHGLMFTVCLATSGSLNGMDPYSPYFLIGVGGSFLLLGKQLWCLDLDSPASCWSAFSSNAFVVGPIVLAGIVADCLLGEFPSYLF